MLDVNTEFFIGKKWSTLGRRVYDEINKLYDSRDEVRDRYPNIDVKMERIKVYNAVIRSGWGKGLLDIIREETNIDIGVIKLIDGMSGAYAIAYDPQYNSIINYANSPLVSRIKLDFKSNSDLKETLDLYFDAMEKEKHQNKVPEEYKSLIRYPVLYFDVSMALMFDRIKTESDIDVSISCAEITAIVLHEVGHAVTISKTVGHTRTLLSDFHAVKPPTLRSKEDVQALINNIKEVHKDIKRRGYSTKDVDNYVEKATQRVQDVLDKDVVPDGFAKRLMYRFISVFLYTNIFSSFIIQSIIEQTIVNSTYRLNIVKLSDFDVAGKIYNQNEFWADEFATMNGFGPEIVSGLGKIIYILRGYDVKAKKGMKNYYAAKQNIITTILLYTSAPLWGRYETHGNDTERYAEIDLRLRKELRRIDGIDKNLEKDLIKEITRAREAIAFANKLNRDSTDDMLAWGDTVRTFMNSTAKAVLFFARASLDEPKYAEVMHEMDLLTNTAMHYQSKKIRDMV